MPFYSGLSVKQVSEAFKRYAKSFNIEIIDRKDPLPQFHASKSCIKNLFKVLLCEMKSFKYQIPMNIKLCKQKMNADVTSGANVEHANVHFNSVAKIVINRSFDWLIDKSFE